MPPIIYSLAYAAALAVPSMIPSVGQGWLAGWIVLSFHGLHVRSHNSGLSRVGGDLDPLPLLRLGLQKGIGCDYEPLSTHHDLVLQDLLHGPGDESPRFRNGILNGGQAKGLKAPVGAAGHDEIRRAPRYQIGVSESPLVDAHLEAADLPDAIAARLDRPRDGYDAPRQIPWR